MVRWGILTAGSWALFGIVWWVFLTIDWRIRQSGRITEGLPDPVMTLVVLLSPLAIILLAVWANRELDKGLARFLSVVIQGAIAFALSYFLLFHYVFAVIGDSY